MNDFLNDLNKELVKNNDTIEGNLSEVVQSLELIGGKGTPTEIANKMFGDKATSKEAKKVRNICQRKGLSSTKSRIIEIGENKFLILTNNVNGREKNLYHIANSQKEAKAIAKI